MAEALGGAFVTTDWRELADKVDAVLVALPHHLHFECGMFFARHGKHVLMEKPLCNTEEECRKLIDTSRDAGIVLMCAYPVPHYPGVRRLYELVKSGEYGCHYIDLILRFLGTPVRGFHLGTNVGTPWMLREGTSAAVLQFESGALAYHGATWGARGTRLGWDIQVQTEKGMLEYDHYTGMVRHYHAAAAHVPGGIEHGRYDILWERGKNLFKLKPHPHLYGSYLACNCSLSQR